MTVALTNRRKRMFTLLLGDGREARAVRIAAGATVRGLPDSVLELREVDQALRDGEMSVARERTSVASGFAATKENA